MTLGDNSSVWFGAVLRGDINRIVVGANSNIQDNAVVHLSDDFGAHIGAWCTVGHAAIVHACRVGDECLIGMGATVLDGAEIGARSIVGANALVPQGLKVPPGSMVYGSPAKVVRDLKPEERPDNHLGKLKIFSGIWQYPARVKCAALAWRAMNGALGGNQIERGSHPIQIP
mgnify:CR=1 FL=1